MPTEPKNDNGIEDGDRTPDDSIASAETQAETETDSGSGQGSGQGSDPNTDPNTGPNTDPGSTESRRSPHAAGMRSVLDTMAAGDPADTLALRDVIQGLGRGTFGVLLFLAALPAFIPIPGLAGALSGPLVVLVGLQVLILLPNPWLPGFVARRGPLRSTVIRFDRKVSPWLRRLEKTVRPRLVTFVEHPLATVFTGLQIVLLGILLSLPIPFTNYLFACLLMIYALALLERDGAMMLIAWACGLAAIGVFGVLSGNLVALAWAWLEKLP